MNTISESKIHHHLHHAIETISPKQADALWEQPVSLAQGDEWYLEGAGGKRTGNKRTFRLLSSIAACLAVVFLSTYMYAFRVDATVYLDVNPSITLEISRNEKILRADAQNPDGAIILEDMNLRRTDLNTAINAILGSMVKHGYLSDTDNVVLLSVYSESTGRTDALRVQLSEEIDACLTALVEDGIVLDQEIEPDEILEDLAETYRFTLGKAALLRALVQTDPTLRYEDLAEMSMDELEEHFSQKGYDLEEFLDLAEDDEEEHDEDTEEPEDVSDDNDDPPETDDWVSEEFEERTEKASETESGISRETDDSDAALPADAVPSS